MSLFYEKYFSFLKKTHPNLCLGESACKTPYFITQINCLEIFKPGLYKFLAHSIHTILPKSATPRALVVGVPFEPYNQNKIYPKRINFKNLFEIAKKNHAEILFFPNFDQPHRIDNVIDPKRLFSTPSFPNMAIQSSFSNFESYLQDFSAKSRYGIRRNIRQFESHGHTIKFIKKITEKDLNNFYNSYLYEFNRAKVSWIPYQKAYFSQFLSECPNSFIFLASAKYGDFLGMIMGFELFNELHICRLAVKEDYFRKDSIYFRLFYAAIDYGFQKKISVINLGPSAYALKRRLKAQVHSQKNFIYPLSMRHHLLLLGYKKICSGALSHLSSIEDLERYF